MSLDISPALFDAIRPESLPVVIAVERGDMPDGLVARTKQVMFEHGIPQGSDDPKLQWMGAPPLGPITDPPGRIPPAAFTALVDQPCDTCSGTGQGRLLVDFGNGGPIPKCWDCFDGIAPVVLRTRCEWCHVHVVENHGPVGRIHRDCAICVLRADDTCPIRGCTDGYRSLKVKVACVPVCDGRTCTAAIQPEYPAHICVFTSGRVAYIWGHSDYIDLDAEAVALLGDPAGWIGSYALVVVEAR